LGGSSSETKDDAEEVVFYMSRCEATRARPVLDIPGFCIFGGSFNLGKPFLVLASCC
jgi:hypothetical protein